jgi:signal transduction histidine kinase
MRWSIRYQLLVPLLILLVGVMGMSVWAALASARQAQHQIEGQVRDIVRTLNQSAFPLSENVLYLLKGLSGADYLLVGPEEQRATTLPTSQVEVPGEVLEAEAWRQLMLDVPVQVGGQTYWSRGVRLTHGPQAGAVLYIFYPEFLWRDALWRAVRPPLVLGLFAASAALILALGVAHRLSRRVQEVERRTRLIAAGDFSPMPLPRRRDELYDLSRSVNDLAAQLARYQETVRRSERLRLLGQVSGGLAHQLRNGVAGARLAVQLHARSCPAGPQEEALDVALRQLARVELHLKRFLDLGRTSDRLRQVCSLRALLEEIVALLGPQCRHAHIELRWQPPAEAGPWLVVGDPGQLGHLFWNVLSNAVEAAGPGGWVALHLERTSSGRFVIQVRDSGPGPAPDIAPRLFEPFVTNKSEGVGLGLAVARQIAEAHGGGLAWQSGVRPTCFVIDLPAAEETADESGSGS